MNSLFSRDLCAALVLSFGHFLWIGILIATVAAVVVSRQRTAAARYRVWLAALVAMTVSPFVTLAILQTMPAAAPVVVETKPIVAEFPSAQRSEPDEGRAAPERPAKSPASLDETIPAGGLSRDTTLPPHADAGALARVVPAPRESAWWRDYAPLVTGLYLIGVALMGLRLSLGLWGGRRLRRRATPITEASLLAALQRQATSLGMKFVPALAYCERVTVPTVLGILKPMILLPVSLASGLAPDQIESVLAHELAHLRRYDHLVNLMQCVMESLLFFHPAVWWVSRRIRDEREHCCDDLVVACGAVPLDYAASLLRVAELSREAEQQRGHNQRRSFAAVSLFATGDRPSTLRQRIARLLGYQAELNVRAVHPWLLFCLATCCVGAVWVLTSMTWIVLAEINRDRSQTTVIVEWSAVIDESVLQEIRALKRNSTSRDSKNPSPPAPLPTTEAAVPEPGRGEQSQNAAAAGATTEIIRCSAADLRAILSNQLGNKRFVLPQENMANSMPTHRWGREERFLQSISNGFIPIEGGVNLYASFHVNWHCDGTTICDEQAERMRLQVKGNYTCKLDDSPQGTAAVKFEEEIADGEVALVVLTPPKGQPKIDEIVKDGNGSRIVRRVKENWNLSAIFVQEAVRVPKQHVELFKSMTRAEDWIRRGPTGTREHVARVVEWRARPSHDVSDADKTWTREMPNGGHVQLVGLGRPNEAPMIWWTPDGEPLRQVSNRLGQSLTGMELAAIVRVWEDGVSRKQPPPQGMVFSGGVMDDPDTFPNPGSQLLVFPAVLDKATGKVSLKIGAGFGVWTAETKIDAAKESKATLNGIEIKTQTSHESHVFGPAGPPNFIKVASTWFHWPRTSDFEFNATAVTRDGRKLPSTADPMVNQNEQRNHAQLFTHHLPKADIQHFLIKSRPIHWTEFTGFAIEPTVALDPPLSFAGSNLTANEVAAEKAAWDEIEAMNVGVYSEANHQRELARHLRQLEKRGNFPEKGLQEIRQQLQLPIRDAELWNVPAKAWPQVGRLLSLRKLRIVASDLRGKPMVEIGHLRDLRRFVVATSKFQPTDLEPLRQLTQLEHLEVTFTVFDETHAQRREQLGDLSEAEQDLVKRVEAVGSDRKHLWQAAILTDRALEQLADLKHLRTVKLINTIISSRGVRMLSKLPALEELELGVVDESPEVVRLVGAMKSLKRLEGLSLTDDVLAEWTALAQLEELGRYAAGVTDQGVDHLLKMTQLRRLVLWHSQLGDAGLERLASLPHLESLDVRFSKSLSQAGVERFQQRNPKCKVAFEQRTDTNAAGTAGQSALPPQPQHYIANLPDGRSIEFVGITKNTAPAEEGWRPDGQRMGDVPEFKVHLGGPIFGGTSSGVPLPEDVNARDFLFEFQGLRDQPSINFQLPFGMPIYVTDPIQDSRLRLRVLAHLNDKNHPFPDAASNPRPHPLRVGLTDEPWGTWQQISATGQFLNQLGENDLHRSSYAQIQFQRVGPSQHLPNCIALVFRQPKQHFQRCAFEIRGFDMDGQVVRSLDWRSQVVAGTDLEEFEWFRTPPLTEGQQLARFEYRLRPFRHWVTFENVSLVPGQKTDVKVKVEPLPEEKKPPENGPDGLLGRMIERPSVELLRELLVPAKTRQPEPVALLDDGRRGREAKGSKVSVIDTGTKRFAIVEARVRPVIGPEGGVVENDFQMLPECAFVFDWQGRLVATLGGQIRKVRGSSVSIDKIDVLRLGPEEDWFVRVMSSRDNEPLYYQTEYYRIANPVIPSLRYFHYPNSNAWSFGPEVRTSRFGTLYFDFPTVSDKFKPREVSSTVDGVPVNREILWDGDRNLFVGAPAQRAKNKPLYQVDAKWSKDFEPLSPKRDQLVVTGGLDERQDRQHACHWAAVVPDGFEAVVTLTIPQRNGPPNVVERRIDPALAHVTVETEPQESEATTRVRLWISEKVEAFDMPFGLGNAPEPQPAIRLLNPGDSAPLLSRPLKSSPEPLRFEIRLLAKERKGDPQSESPQKQEPRAEREATTVVGTVVTPDGQPVAGIEVLVFQGGKQLEQKFTTDKKGEFRVPKAWREVDHWLTVVAREGRERLGWFDFMIHGHSIGGQNPEDGSFRLVLLPMNRTVRGRVLDESSQPLAQIPVRINQLDHEVNSESVHWKYQKLGDEPLVLGAVTDNDGRFELKLPADSVAMLGMSHPDWVEQRICVTKEKDEVGATELVRAAKVAGRVIDSRTGKPLAGVTISANATKTEILESGGDEAKTDADGRFLIQGLRSGKYTIQLEKSPFQTLTAPAHVGAMLKSGETFMADFSLSVGKRLTGRVLDMDTGEPIPSCKVTYTGPARPGHGLSTETNKRGEFEFFVPPGRSSLDATEGRRFGNDSTREIDVPADGDPEPIVLKVGEKTEPVPGSFKIFIGPPLNRKVSLNFKDTPLVEALEGICQTAGMKLELDEAGLTSAGYSKDTPVTLVEAKLVTLQDALTLALKPYEKLSFCVDKNQIFVSTHPQVEAREKPTAKPKSPAENAADKP